ncbi:MAG: hypothetical protein J0G96_13120 [Flavobacteriia bacterium]|nr:hypothetical protein [Flavobacteriia bacterium]OJX34864.1 MAG: hypothetical protein BGO87_08955 [Flavobacteriia bacterium 40-80]
MNQLKKINKRPKDEQQSVSELLQLISKVQAEIEELKENQLHFQQERIRSLGPLFKEIRQVLFKQLTALDRLYNTGAATKKIQKTISSEITEIVDYLRNNFNLEKEEVLPYQTIIQFHTGQPIPFTEVTDNFSDKQPRPAVISLDEKQLQHQLKNIYKDLMKYFHPDRNQHPDAETKAKEITSHYENRELKPLLEIYQATFPDAAENEISAELKTELSNRLDELYDEYNMLTSLLGTAFSMTEKSIKKRVKAETRQFREFLEYQKQLLNIVFSDPDHFEAYQKQKKR